MYITDYMNFMVKSLQNVPFLLNGNLFVILNFLWKYVLFINILTQVCP